MAATLPDLETVNLRRGASNGAELRIELNRPERMNAWDKQFGLDLLAAVQPFEVLIARSSKPASSGMVSVLMSVPNAGRPFCTRIASATSLDIRTAPADSSALTSAASCVASSTMS